MSDVLALPCPFCGTSFIIEPEDSAIHCPSISHPVSDCILSDCLFSYKSLNKLNQRVSTIVTKPNCEKCRHYQKEGFESGKCPLLGSLLEFKYEEGPPFDGFTPVKSVLVPKDFSCSKFDEIH